MAFDNGYWMVRDLRSANGIFVNGERVESVPIFTSLKVRLGVLGPFVELELAPNAAVVVPSATAAPPVTAGPPVGTASLLSETSRESTRDAPLVKKAASHYFGNPDDQSIGDHTRMIRRAYVEVQNKQKRAYGGIIVALVLCAIAAGGSALYYYKATKKHRADAESMFYTMKAIEVEIANVERMVAGSGNAEAAARTAGMRSQRKSMDDSYQKMLVSLKVYDPKLTEEQKLVLQVARIFGECELDVPKEFYAEVDKYIGYWKSTPKFRNAIRLAKEKGYAKGIADEFISQGLSPQFFYLALQESSFDEHAVGPMTYMGYAKGMWQFIPATAADYGLNVGPLVTLPQVDVGDDRHHWDKSTKAAASYIKFLYSTDAQASGLLVMACYNWGERSVLKFVQTMPKNPRERNFWKLLTLHRDKIPDETYKYVLSITSAAVIGQNPRLFGFDFDDPLAGYNGK